MSIAVLINGNARKGSERVYAWARELLPQAHATVTHSSDDARRWLEQEVTDGAPLILLGGGGDGTMVGILNELRRLGRPFPVLGALPLGTGNAWAHVTGGHSARECLTALSRWGDRPPPTRTFSLVEVDGHLGHFAGTGWDAEVVHDFQRLRELPLPPLPGIKRLQGGLLAYLLATVTRTVPRHLAQKERTKVRLINLGAPALTVDERGEPAPLQEPESRVLYEGPASVASASTTTEWGFGFRAFPFAHAVEGRISTRIYQGGVLQALMHAPGLWRGEHPMPLMHDFLLTQGRMEFDRPVPFQVGGDLEGMRDAFEFRLAKEKVRLLDWNTLCA